MPLLALLYVVLMCLLGLGALTTDISERKPVWYTSLNVASVATMILMFTGYWIAALVESIRILAPSLFLFSLTWEIYSSCCEIGPGIEREAQQLPAEVRSIAKGLSVGFEVIACGIGYSFGGIAVWRAI